MSNQTPRQQLEAAIEEAIPHRHAECGASGCELPRLRYQAFHTVLAVLKGLPAMQGEELPPAKDSLVRFEFFVTRNALRRRILAELEEDNGSH